MHWTQGLNRIESEIMKGYPDDVTTRAAMRAKFEAWRTNTRWRVMGWLVRKLGLEPYCPCGWPLAQRFDGQWVCGSCVKADRGYFDTTGGVQPRP